MTQHYTRNTVEVSAWCKRCRKDTMHRVDGVKLGACQVCLKKLNETKPEPKPEPEQLDMFGNRKLR